MIPIHELPNQALTYARRGLRAVEQADYTQAWANYQKSYQLDPTPEIFVELVYIALYAGQFDKLAALWEQYYPQVIKFPRQPAFFEAYIHSVPYLYSLNESILRLHQVQPYYAELTFDDRQLQALLSQQYQLLDLRDEVGAALDAGQIKNYYEKYITENYEVFIKRLAIMIRLDYEYIKDLSQLMLEDDRLPNFAKTIVLVRLCELDQLPQQFEIIWFHQKRSILADQVGYPYDHPLLHQAKHLISAYCEQEDPHLEHNLHHLLNQYALCLHPFIDEAVTSAEVWCDFILQRDHMPPFAVDQALLSDETTYLRLAEREIALMQLLMIQAD